MDEWNKGQLPPAICSLTPLALHVWRIQLHQHARVIEPLGKMLSDDERVRAERFYFEHDRRNFILARGALRDILSRYIGAQPARILFAHGAQGKPALPGNPVHFNLAHSGDWALCAVALQPVGVDVEDMRRPVDDMNDVARRFFAPAECKALMDLPAQAKTPAFFRCWTRKEAFIKALGEGLSRPLNRFEVSFAQDAPAALLRIDGNAIAAQAWTMLNIPPDAEHAGAAALPFTPVHIERWTWQAFKA